MSSHPFPTDTDTDRNLPFATDGKGYCVLPAYGLLRVAGADAESFLQGQSTCDAAALAPGAFCPGAFCTPKGRVIANFRLLRGDTAFHLLLPAALAETVLKRLRLYVLRSQVSLENLTPDRVVLGLLDKDSDAVPAAMGIAAPEPGRVTEAPGLLALKPEADGSRCLIAADAATAERLRDALAGWTRLHPAAWLRRDIEAGWPEVTPPLAEEFLPQMLNLDLLGGIGLQKGCYTGQEIVARTHYLGQLKRRLFRLRTASGREPNPGDTLYDAAAALQGAAGQIVSAAPTPAEGTFECLAVIALDRARSGDLRLFGPEGPKAEILTLPYTSE